MELQHEFNDEMDTYIIPEEVPTNEGKQILTFTTDLPHTAVKEILKILTSHTT